MFEAGLSTLLIEGLRLLVLLALPVSGAVVLVGLIGAILQAATTVHDGVTLYVMRATALVVSLVFLLPGWLDLFLRWSGDLFSGIAG